MASCEDQKLRASAKLKYSSSKKFVIVPFKRVTPNYLEAVIKLVTFQLSAW